MLEVIQKKYSAVIAVSFGFLALFIMSGSSARAELAPGSVQLDKDFSQKIIPYIFSQPVIAGPFTGGKEADMVEILPFFTQPLTRYNLTFGSVPPKQSFKTGEKLDLKGNLSFSFNAAESQKALSEIKGCEGCPVSETYHFPILSDVGVFAQVWRKDEDKTQSPKGDYLVDEFYAGNGFDLNENEITNFDLNWQVPEKLREGNYYLLLFVNSNKRFNLAGTPLVAFYQAATFDFRVSNENAGNALNQTVQGNGVELDKNNITINGSSYVYRQPAPEITPDNGSISVKLPISNLDPNEQNVKVSYSLYGWGQEDPGDLINTKQENISIASGDKSSLEYTFSPSETGSVYNLEVKAVTPGSVSTSNIRFVVKGINRGIFRFLGKARNDQQQMLPVFCIRNAAWSGLFNGKVRIAALGANDQVLKTFEKQGSVRPEDRCFAIKDSSWLKDGKATKLQGEIYNGNGNLVDKKTVSLISKKADELKSADGSKQNLLSNLPASKLQILLAVLLIVVLGIGGYLILLRSKKEE